MPKKHRILDLYPKRSAPTSVEAGHIAVFTGEDGYLYAQDEDGLVLPLGMTDAGESAAKSVMSYEIVATPMLDGVEADVNWLRDNGFSAQEFMDEWESPKSGRIYFPHPGTYLLIFSCYWDGASATIADEVLFDVTGNDAATISTAVVKNSTPVSTWEMRFVTVTRPTTIGTTVVQNGSPDSDFAPNFYAYATAVGHEPDMRRSAGSTPSLFNAQATVNVSGGATVAATLTGEVVGDDLSLSSGKLHFDKYGQYLVLVEATAPDQGQSYLDVITEFSGSGQIAQGAIPDDSRPTRVWKMYVIRGEDEDVTWSVTQIGGTGSLAVNLRVSVAPIGRDFTSNYVLDLDTTADIPDHENTPFALTEASNDFYSSSVTVVDTELIFERAGTYLVMIQTLTGSTASQTFIDSYFTTSGDGWDTHFGIPNQGEVIGTSSAWNLTLVTTDAYGRASIAGFHDGSGPLSINCKASIISIGGPDTGVVLDELAVSSRNFDYLSTSIETFYDFSQAVDGALDDLTETIDGYASTFDSFGSDISNLQSADTDLQSQIDAITGGGGTQPRVLLTSDSASTSAINFPSLYIDIDTTYSVAFYITTVDSLWVPHLQSDLVYDMLIHFLVESLEVPGNFCAFSVQTPSYGDIPYDNAGANFDVRAVQGVKMSAATNVLTFAESGWYKLTLSTVGGYVYS